MFQSPVICENQSFYSTFTFKHQIIPECSSVQLTLFHEELHLHDAPWTPLKWPYEAVLHVHYQYRSWQPRCGRRGVNIYTAASLHLHTWDRKVVKQWLYTCMYILYIHSLTTNGEKELECILSLILCRVTKTLETLINIMYCSVTPPPIWPQ